MAKTPTPPTYEELLKELLKQRSPNITVAFDKTAAAKFAKASTQQKLQAAGLAPDIAGAGQTAAPTSIFAKLQGAMSIPQAVGTISPFMRGNGSSRGAAIQMSPQERLGLVQGYNSKISEYTNNIQATQQNIRITDQNFSKFLDQTKANVEKIGKNITDINERLAKTSELSKLLSNRVPGDQDWLLANVASDARANQLIRELYPSRSLYSMPGQTPSLDYVDLDVVNRDVKSLQQGLFDATTDAQKQLADLKKAQAETTESLKTYDAKLKELESAKVSFDLDWRATNGSFETMHRVAQIDGQLASIDRSIADELRNPQYKDAFWNFEKQDIDFESRDLTARNKLRADLEAERARLAGPRPAAQKPSFKQKYGQAMEFGGGAATATAGGYKLFDSIFDMVRNGQHGLKEIGGAAASLGLLAGGLAVMGHAVGNATHITTFAMQLQGIPFIGPMLYKAMLFMTSPLGIAIIAGAIVTAAILKGLFGPKPTEAEKEMEELNKLTVWDPRGALLMTSAAAFISMGYGIDKPMPINSNGIAVPTAQLRTALTGNLAKASGAAYTGSIPYGMPLVIKGEDGDRVVVITKDGRDARGNAVDRVKVYDLPKDMVFEAPKGLSGAYRPFMVNGKVNAETVQAIGGMRAMLEACDSGIMDAKTCANAVKLAASASASEVNALPPKR